MKRVAVAVLGAMAVAMTACVTNPVTGQMQLSFIGKESVKSLAAEAVPSQFASDYGVVKDTALNAYVDGVGKKLVATLKPEDTVFQDMPFSFQVVNAVYVNAYAFPDGTIAITRGMLAELEDEAQLAAVLGHEIAHVNCGHTAAAMSKSTVLSALVAGSAGYLAVKGKETMAALAGTGGALGTAVVQASYSRKQEHEADLGGTIYMTRAGYDPQGMVRLMELLVRIGNSNPSLVERMMASHPMSADRLAKAKERAAGEYANVNKGNDNRAAYLAQTAGIQKNKAAIRLLAQADGLLAQQQYAAAKTAAEGALKAMPNDYVGLMIVAQANKGQGNAAGATQAAALAARANPSGARAQGLLAQQALEAGQYTQAMGYLNTYEKMVPNDPQTMLHKGVIHEQQGNKSKAQAAYQAYVQKCGTGSQGGQYAASRLSAMAPAAASGTTASRDARRTGRP